MAKGVRIGWLSVAAALAASAPAPASAAPLPAPGGFRLAASHGYSIRAIAFDGERLGEHDELVLLVARRGASALYFVQAGVRVTETTVSADLGRLGSVDLRFVPSGTPRVERSACDPHPFEFDSGFYEGEIDFAGEEGYAQAHAIRAQGEIRLEASLICVGGVDEGFGGRSPGARLQVRRLVGGDEVEFEATKNSPRRPSRFNASIEEKRDGLVVDRGVGAVAGPAAFGFNVRTQLASLRPPAPFEGAASFLRPGAG